MSKTNTLHTGIIRFGQTVIRWYIPGILDYFFGNMIQDTSQQVQKMSGRTEFAVLLTSTEAICLPLIFDARTDAKFSME
jgi:hypothetical protein